ncbi:MAG: hypothetical protein ABF809_00940, partial [Gluconobacter potus]|uniref:hypothetical protein n=1 Tax=Gluconobacter potus TaxID=2724927 RepID=UPI0039E97F70
MTAFAILLLAGISFKSAVLLMNITRPNILTMCATGFGTLRRSHPRFAPGCLQNAYIPVLRHTVNKKRSRRNIFNRLIFLGKSGAGDGIRTHDPNLGKVVL